MAIKFHYGSQTFTLPDSQADALDGFDGTPGTIKLNLGDGKWLEFAVGPGIPMALESVKPGRVTSIR